VGCLAAFKADGIAYAGYTVASCLILKTLSSLSLSEQSNSAQPCRNRGRGKLLQGWQGSLARLVGDSLIIGADTNHPWRGCGSKTKLPTELNSFCSMELRSEGEALLPIVYKLLISLFPNRGYIYHPLEKRDTYSNKLRKTGLPLFYLISIHHKQLRQGEALQSFPQRFPQKAADGLAHRLGCWVQLMGLKQSDLNNERCSSFMGAVGN